MKYFFWITIILLITVLGLRLRLWQVLEQKEVEQALVATFLDVGQGDATFIELASGEQLLIDCAKDARILHALGRILPFYDRDLDYLVVTHADNDHYGGCGDVLQRFDVETVVVNGIEKQGDLQFDGWRELLADSGAERVILTAPTQWEIASTTIDFLYPDHDVAVESAVPGTNADGDNNNSIVMKVTYGNAALLLTGDAEAPLEHYLISTYGKQLDADVLKVGHHGSGSSSIEAFLHVVTPTVSVISSGKDNPYGHPSRRVLRRLQRADSSVYRTDRDGDVVVRCSVSGCRLH